jgi:hypothetical protein
MPKHPCCTFCSELIDGRDKHCGPCSGALFMYREYANGARIAISAVSCAIKRGDLPPPSNFKCTDCDKPAAQYDHRDYSKPLDVQPVCRSCNYKRGRALPKDWSFDECLAWIKPRTKIKFNAKRLKLVFTHFSRMREAA